MGNNWLFFIEPDGGFFHMDPLMPLSLGSFDSSSYLFVPGSSALQEAFNCISKLAGAVVFWFASRSNFNTNRRIACDHVGSRPSSSGGSTRVKNLSSVRSDLKGFFWRSNHRRKSAIQDSFGKVSSFALKQMYREAERLHSFPLLSLAAALVPPMTKVSSNVLAIPMEASSVEAHRFMDQRPCEIENRRCGPCTEMYFQSLSWSKNSVEPRTGIEFPTMLDNSISGDSNSSFIPEVLVGTGSRTMTVIRIKSLKVYAFGFYVHPFDICEKLGPKYARIPDNELNKCQDFYQDLLREDINMTIRLVVTCNGIKINTVKDVFEKSLRARMTRSNPDADLGCLQAFGSVFSQDLPLHVGTTINFHRTADGHLMTEVGGNHIGTVQSKDLCRAFFDMYIGESPVCEQTKEEIGKNVASIIGLC